MGKRDTEAETRELLLQQSECQSLSHYQRTFLCRRWNPTQRPTAGRCTKWRFWNSQSYMGCLPQTSPLRAQEAKQKQRRKDCKSLEVRVGMDRCLQGNCLQDTTDQCTYELSEPVAANTGAEWVQARLGPSAEGGSGHGIPSLTQELSAIDILLQRKT